MVVANDKGFTSSVKALDAATHQMRAAHWAIATYLADADLAPGFRADADTLGALIWRAYKAACRVAEVSNPCRRGDAGAAAIGRALSTIVALADNCREALARWPHIVDEQTVACVNYARGAVQCDNYRTPANRPLLRIAERCKYWPRDCEPTVEGVAEWIRRKDEADRVELAALAA